MPTFDFRIYSQGFKKQRHVKTSRFENQSEQRRLITSRNIMDIQWRTPPLTLAQGQALEAFYEARDGELEAFDYVYQGVTYKMRFLGELEWDHKPETGGDNVYIISGAFRLLPGNEQS